MDSKKNTSQILLSVLGVFVLVVAVVGVSFAAFSYTRTGEKVNTLTTGAITMSYTDVTNGINITDALPMSDTNGKALSATNQYFDFTVAATISGTATINYAITATKEDDSTLPDTGVKVYLTSGASNDAVDGTVALAPSKVSALTKTVDGNTAGAPKDQYQLATGSITTSTDTFYRLRMWVADDYAEASGSVTQKTYKLRVNVYGQAAAQ